MEEFIIDEHTGLNYELVGDYYLLAGENDPVPTSLGIWGQRHLNYLKTHKEGIYTELWLSGKLDIYLVEMNQQAEDAFFQLVNALAETEGITEQIKETDQMAWVAAMNSIHARATEIVYKELIFV